MVDCLLKSAIVFFEDLCMVNNKEAIERVRSIDQ